MERLIFLLGISISDYLSSCQLRTFPSYITAYYVIKFSIPINSSVIRILSVWVTVHTYQLEALLKTLDSEFRQESNL